MFENTDSVRLKFVENIQYKNCVKLVMLYCLQQNYKQYIKWDVVLTLPVYDSKG